MNITVKQLFSVIRKNIIFIILCTIICLSGSYLISKFILPKSYVSTVKLYVSTPQSTTNTSAADINALNYAQKVVNTYIEMLQTNNFYQKVADKSGAHYTLEDLKKMVQFSSLNDTEVFQATVSSSNPNEAKLIADSITELAPTTISQLKETAMLKVVDSASLPDKPVSPNTAVNSIIGFFLGLIGSLLFLLLRDTLDIRIKNEDDIIENYNIPVIASIPAFNSTFTKQSTKYARRETK